MASWKLDDDTAAALARARPNDVWTTEAARVRARAALLDRTGAGPTLGRFRIHERIGCGGMAVVYGAHDPTLERDVALKVVAIAGSRDRERVLREARSQARVAHPNVVSIFEVEDHGDVVAIAMERVEGDLRRWLGAATRSWRAIAEVFVAVGRGLAAAHDRGLVHGDVKPENILIGADGRPQVADFGLARMASDSSQADDDHGGPGRRSPGSSATVSGGTPAYMAPELLAGGEATATSDQFALAVSLFEGVCGERPFRGGNVAALAAAMRADLVLPHKLDRALASLFERALAPDPGQRFPSMAALVVALERIVQRHPRRRGITEIVPVPDTSDLAEMESEAETDRAAVLDTLDGFFAAYQAKDVARSMSFFASSPRTTAIGSAPDEHRIGLPAIRALLERDVSLADTIALAFSWTQIDVEDQSARVAREGNYTLVANGERIVFPIRYTAELIERQGRWLISQAHLSVVVDNP